MFEVQESESIFKFRVSDRLNMKENMVEYVSIIENRTRSWFGRFNFALSLFGFFGSHFILLDFLLELLSKFDGLHQIFTILETLSSFLGSGCSIDLEDFVFGERINLVSFGNVNFSELLLGFFEHEFLFPELSFLVDKHLLLSLPPDADAFIGGDCHKEVADAGNAKAPDFAEEIVEYEHFVIGVCIEEFDLLVFGAGHEVVGVADEPHACYRVLVGKD